MDPQDSTGTTTDAAPERKERRHTGRQEEEELFAWYRRQDVRMKREVKCLAEPSLLHVHRWGGTIARYRKHKMWRYEKHKNLSMLCKVHYGFCRTTTYEYLQLFRALRRNWIKLAGKRVVYKDALLIAKMRVRDKMPAVWIRKILWDCLAIEKCGSREMERIVDGVQAALEALGEKEPPGEEWLREVIEEAREEDPTEAWRRELDGVSASGATLVKRALGMLDRQQDREGVDLKALKSSIEEVWGQQEQINEVLGRLRAALESENELPLTKEKSPPRRNAEIREASLKNEVPDEKKLDPSPQAAPDTTSNDRNPNQRQPAPRPEKWTPEQFDIPINYPAIAPINPLGLNSCLLIVDMEEIGRAMETYRDLSIRRGDQVHPKLQLLALRALDRFYAARRIILSALKDCADEGKARLTALAQQAPGTTWKDHFPLSLDRTAAEKFPMAWLTYECIDPMSSASESHTDCEVMVWHLIGLVDRFEQLIDQFAELAEQDMPLADVLACQLRTALERTGDHMGRFRFLVAQDGEAWARIEAAEEAALAEFRAQAQARIITLGEPSLAAQYVVIGLTPDGRLVAITLNTPQLILGIGRQGSGKSHLAVLLMEGATIRYNGTGQLVHPLRVIRIGGDWHQGVSGDSLKAGFYPNTDPTHWDYLRNYYAIQRGNAAFRGAYLFCLKDSLARFQHKFAELMRRGFIILPLEMDPSEMAHYGYAAFLSGGGAEGKGKNRTAWKALIDNIISWHGEELTPQVLERELGKHRLDYRVKDSVRLQLRQLGQIVVKGKYLVDALERGCPILVYLESRYVGKDQVLPLELAVMNALSRPLRNGEDPPRIIILDEFNANLMNEGTAPLILEAGSQLRHRPIWYYLSGQRITDFPVGIGALATIVAVFNTPSAAEFTKEREIFGWLHGRQYHRDIAPLVDGQALMAAVRASDRRMVDSGLVVSLRPSIVQAMGETYRVIG